MISTVVQPDTGKVRVILVMTGDGGSIAEETTLFTLKGKVKSRLASSNTSISITKFEVASEGELGNVNIEDATHTFAITAASSTGGSTFIPTPDPDNAITRLEQAVTTATTKLERAKEGEKVGQYKEGAIAKLQQAIEAARSNGDATAALSSLNEAVTAFNNERVTLTGTGAISIADLSMLVKYYGITSSDASWSEIKKADVMDANEINIQTLAAIAQMIATDN